MAPSSNPSMTPAFIEQLHVQLKDGVHSMGLRLSNPQLALLLDYLQLLVKWNQAYNLTAIRDPQNMLVEHILDSLSIMPFIAEHARCIDVGTGPGLPGLILAIACPSTRWVLLDSNGKKTRFCQQVVAQLELDHVEVMQTRVEAFQPDVSFDCVTTRAFSDLSDIIDKTQHLLAKDGLILAMKGTDPKQELQKLSLHGKVHPIKVPFMDKQRHLVCLTGNFCG